MNQRITVDRGHISVNRIPMVLHFLYLLVAFCSCSSYNPHKDGLDQELGPPDPPKGFTFFSKLSQTFALLNRDVSTEQISLEEPPGVVTTIPFEFPFPSSYGMTHFSKIAKMVGTDGQHVQSIFVRIIYRLLQFHIKRLFKLNNYEYAVPRGNRYTGVEWDSNPDAWFSSLMTAFFPEASLSHLELDVPARIKNAHFRQFDGVKEGDHLEFFPVLNNDSAQACMRIPVGQCDPHKVVLYTLPKPFWNVTLPPGFTILTGLNLHGDVLCMGSVVESLVCGLAFAFVVNDEEFDVLVTPTKDTPSLEASKLTFNSFTQTPITATNLPIPHNIETMLDNFQVPRLFCYHPVAFIAVPKQYERVLGQIVMGRIVEAWQQFGLKASWQSIAAHLQKSLTSFLPDCLVLFCEGTTLPRQQIGEWNPDSGTYLIYKEGISKRQVYYLILNVGKPLNLSLKQLGDILEKVYPQRFVVPTIIAKNILIARMFYALWRRDQGTLGPEIQDKSKPTLPAQKPVKKKKRAKVKKFQAEISNVKAVLQKVVDTTSRVFVEFMQELESSHLASLTELAFAVNSVANDYQDAAQAVGKALELVKPASGTFRYTILTLNTPCVPHIIAQQMIPLPTNTIFAFLSNGQILRTSLPIIFVSYPYGDFFLWVDTQDVGKSMLSDREQTFAIFNLEEAPQHSSMILLPNT